MSQITIKIGGRSFDVVCQEGEENYLKTAAAMLDEEAQKLESAGARITESRMLLMAGLLLADRTAASEEKLSKTNNTPFSEAPNIEIMESDSILDAKLKDAELEI
jgi:cell division protein ZapA